MLVQVDTLEKGAIVPGDEMGGRSAIAGSNDTVARNRALPLLATESIPYAPVGYEPTSPEERRRRLRFLADALMEEAAAAMREQILRAETLRIELGDLAPDPAQAAPLLARFEQALANRKALELATQYNEESLAIVASDIVQHLEGSYKELDHRVARMPQLERSYAKLVAFFEARSAAIVEGIARNKTRAKVRRSDEGDGAAAP